MTTPSPRDKKTNFGKLFSGVSAAALFLGVFGGTARAAASSVTTNNTTIMVTGTASNSDLTLAGIDEVVVAGNGGLLKILNNGTVDVNMLATGDFNVDATAYGLRQWFYGTMTSTAAAVTISATNASSAVIDVQGTASGTGIDLRLRGVSQLNFSSGANGGDIGLSVDNSGSISVAGLGKGTGTDVYATGINQTNYVVGSTVGNVSLTASNAGTVDVVASATGQGGTQRATGINQFNYVSSADMGTVELNAMNDGTINVTVHAAESGAALANGIEQGFSAESNAGVGDVDLLIDNSGDLNVSAAASGSSPYLVVQGISQNAFVWDSAEAGNLTISASNSGSIDVVGSVIGDDPTAWASGILQYNVTTGNVALGDVSYSINNSGNLKVLLQGTASGTGTQSATVSAFGAVQVARGTASGSIDMSLINENDALLKVTAGANATGVSGATRAYASASAVGVRQRNGSTNQPNAAFTFSNSGAVHAAAQATATGAVTSNTAMASAVGYSVVAGATNQAAALDVANDGTLTVKATANATNAVANATGMVFNAAVLTGTVSNSGKITVTASAPSGSAHAIGVQFNGDVNTVTFTNTGEINVLAKGSTTATGIGFGASTNFANTATPSISDVITIVNDGGSISAMIDSGGTLDYGTAINALGAPSPVMIDLQGGGSVAGNILIDNDDSIFVNNGKTFFEGTVNGNATLEGALTVGSSGTFSMAVGSSSQEAKVFVDTYTQTSTGTLTYTIDTSTTMLGLIRANVADIDGAFQLNLMPGLYGDTITFSDVIAASTLNGEFNSALLNTNSVFFEVTPVYPGDDTVDIVLTRNAFNSLAGLTQNQMSIADVLENTYSTTLTGEYGDLVQELLVLDATDFAAGVDMLHGAEHAQNERALLSSFQGMKSAITNRVNVGPYWTRSGKDVIKRGDMTFWASANSGWGKNDGDAEASGFDESDSSFYAGFDLAPTTSAVFGAAVGYFKNDLTFDNGNLSKNHGVQFSLYGYHDVGRLYLRGLASYGKYKAETARAINIGSFHDAGFGNYDVTAFSFDAELGRRFTIARNTRLTPFVGITYDSVKMDAFTETGLGDLNLMLPKNSTNAMRADFGARFSSAFILGSGGLFVPEISVAYENNFGDQVIGVDAAFAGVPNSDFHVLGADVSSGSLIADLAMTLVSKGGLELRVHYNGRFNSQYRENSAGIRLTILFDN